MVFSTSIVTNNGIICRVPLEDCIVDSAIVCNSGDALFECRRFFQQAPVIVPKGTLRIHASEGIFIWAPIGALELLMKASDPDTIIVVSLNGRSPNQKICAMVKDFFSRQTTSPPSEEDEDDPC